ncbi:MAG TPA: hypothetical protein ENN61_00105 [Bacteroidaceae bacterium]|nr:hypothetical protein [Bacteroidaceae bacterium]
MKNLLNILNNLIKLASYNMRIIFGGRFVYFVLSAFIFFLVFGAILAFNQNEISLSTIYGLLSLPAILLVFYPSVFGIQSDADQGTLEIIFGIPNYRYKVWLVRFVMVLLLTFILLIPFTGIAHYALISVPLFEMTGQLMVLVFFTSTLGFCISTIIKNGNASAVIIVIIGLIFLMLNDTLSESKWNILLNPFKAPGNMNEIVWMEIIRHNRIFMIISGIVFLLLGLLNLQNREKFLH